MMNYVMKLMNSVSKLMNSVSQLMNIYYSRYKVPFHKPKPQRSSLSRD